ncbi:hypothetical protein EV356DRAFT_416953, partial [Viridothelium virens]
KLLLQADKVDVDSKDSIGRTPLSWAAEFGHKTMIKLLLRTDQVVVDSMDSAGQTPLFWAVASGHEGSV